MWARFTSVHTIVVFAGALGAWALGLDEMNLGIAVGVPLVIVLFDVWISPWIVGFMWLVRSFVSRPWRGLVLVALLTVALALLIQLAGVVSAQEAFADPLLPSFAVTGLIVAVRESRCGGSLDRPMPG